jgi:hypothetical protein
MGEGHSDDVSRHRVPDIDIKRVGQEWGEQ